LIQYPFVPQIIGLKSTLVEDEITSFELQLTNKGSTAAVSVTLACQLYVPPLPRPLLYVHSPFVSLFAAAMVSLLSKLPQTSLP
jgi:hypothetical protein